MNEENQLFYFLTKERIKECKKSLDKYIQDNKYKWTSDTIINKIDMNKVVKDFFDEQYFPLRTDKYKDKLLADCRSYLEKGIWLNYVSNIFEEDKSMATILKNKDITVSESKIIKYAIYDIDTNEVFISKGCSVFLVKQAQESLIDVCKRKLNKNDIILVNSLDDIGDSIIEILEFLNYINTSDIILELTGFENISILSIISMIKQLSLLTALKSENEIKENNKKRKTINKIEKNQIQKPINKGSKYEIKREDINKLIAFGGTYSYSELAEKLNCSVNIIKNYTKKIKKENKEGVKNNKK